MNDSLTDQALARDIAQAIALRGGRAYYVGGFVRDHLLGRSSKDIDIEVFGLAPIALRETLEDYGTVVEVGAAFGILKIEHSHIDIAMPRTESSFGCGHRDFDVIVDPSLSLMDAARRRDFTINAMYQDILSGTVVDPFDGQRDLAERTLRHVDDIGFVQDALRVFRAAQFAARFDLAIAPQTLALCANMAVEHLSRERVFDELSKALLQAGKPSIFFRVLREMDQLKTFFPEIAALIGVEQNPLFHPEGDVFEHTMLVLDAAAALRGQAQQPLFFMLAALCHDLGKANATVKDPITGKITAHRHPETGMDLTRSLLGRLTAQTQLIDYVVNMVGLHMRPNLLAQSRSKPVKTRLLFDAALAPEDLILLSRADASGKLDAPYDPAHEQFLRERLADYRERMAQPGIMGRDLINAGYAPGKHFGAMLTRAHRLHLSGMSPQEILRQLTLYPPSDSDE